MCDQSSSSFIDSTFHFQPKLMGWSRRPAASWSPPVTLLWPPGGPHSPVLGAFHLLFFSLIFSSNIMILSLICLITFIFLIFHPNFFFSVKIGLFCNTPGIALARNLPRKLLLDMLLTSRAIDAQGGCHKFMELSKNALG
jgi:hypothetical protein